VEKGRIRDRLQLASKLENQIFQLSARTQYTERSIVASCGTAVPLRNNLQGIGNQYRLDNIRDRGGKQMSHEDASTVERDTISRKKYSNGIIT
jgi:hypothetical protein